MSRFHDWQRPVIDDDGWTKYGWRCQYPEWLKLGHGVDIGCFTYMNARHGIEIGEDVQIGSHCSIYSDNTENKTRGKVIIGKGALIGAHCIILPGTTIRPHAKIRAQSILNGGIYG